MATPKRYLTDLKITRIALVDQGDNPRADIVLWKRKPGADGDDDPPVEKQTMQEIHQDGPMPAMPKKPRRKPKAPAVKKDGYGDIFGQPQTTDEILLANELREEWCEVKYAFHDSLNAILASAPTADRLALLQKSVAEFVARVQTLIPDAQLDKILEKLREPDLTDADLGAFAKRATLLTDEADRLLATEDSMKKDNAGDPAVTEIDLAKLSAEQRPAVEALIKRATDAEAALAAVEKSKTDGATLVAAEKTRADKLQAEVVRLKELAGETENPLDKVDPEIRKRLEDTEAAVAKMREKEEVADLAKAAAPLNLIGTTPDRIAPMLHRIQKGKATDADMKELFRLLKSSGEMARKNGLAEFGTTPNAGSFASDGGTPYERAVAMAKEIVEKGEAKSVSVALAKVWDRNPALYKEHVAQKRANA